jgi:hypothetical protein
MPYEIRDLQVSHGYATTLLIAKVGSQFSDENILGKGCANRGHKTAQIQVIQDGD